MSVPPAPALPRQHIADEDGDDDGGSTRSTALVMIAARAHTPFECPGLPALHERDDDQDQGQTVWIEEER
jgi:hypothetical protein